MNKVKFFREKFIMNLLSPDRILFLSFQLTESVQDSGYFGPTKMRFTPFMRVEHQGSFLTLVIRGLEAVNVQLGISSLTVDPAGSCICGIMDIQEVDV